MTKNFSEQLPAPELYYTSYKNVLSAVKGVSIGLTSWRFDFHHKWSRSYKKASNVLRSHRETAQKDIVNISDDFHVNRLSTCTSAGVLCAVQSAVIYSV